MFISMGKFYWCPAKGLIAINVKSICSWTLPWSSAEVANWTGCRNGESTSQSYKERHKKIILWTLRCWVMTICWKKKNLFLFIYLFIIILLDWRNLDLFSCKTTSVCQSFKNPSKYKLEYASNDRGHTYKEISLRKRMAASWVNNILIKYAFITTFVS